MSLNGDFKKKLTITEQVAETLRRGIQEARWKGTIPGRELLAREMGVSPMTIIRALSLLEQEGLLSPAIPGRRRGILEPKIVVRTALRVTILTFDFEDKADSHLIELKHRLLHAGYSAEFASRTLTDLKVDVQRVAKFVEKTETDAWVVMAASREILSWFSEQPVPVFALFGGMLNYPIAGTGPDMGPAYQAAARRFIDLGHHRIVLLQQAHVRGSTPGRPARMFLAELEAHGVETGPYNCPLWTDTPDGLQRCIDSLFAHTPPTALLVSTPPIFHAVREHLAKRRMIVPQDVSLVCGNDDPTFRMCDPAVACMRWDIGPCINQIIRWVDKVARGVNDRKQRLVKVKFFEGGTVGPAPTRKKR